MILQNNTMVPSGVFHIDRNWYSCVTAAICTSAFSHSFNLPTYCAFCQSVDADEFHYAEECTSCITIHNVSGCFNQVYSLVFSAILNHLFYD